jgi:hypothetical protein
MSGSLHQQAQEPLLQEQTEDQIVLAWALWCL